MNTLNLLDKKVYAQYTNLAVTTSVRGDVFVRNIYTAESDPEAGQNRPISTNVLIQIQDQPVV